MGLLGRLRGKKESKDSRASKGSKPSKEAAEDDGDESSEAPEAEVEAPPETKPGSKAPPDEEIPEGPRLRESAADRQRAMRRTIQTGLVVLNFIGYAYCASAASTQSKTWQHWNRGICKFNGFIGDCAQCNMQVNIGAQTSSGPAQYIATWVPLFTYSYYTDSHILAGDMFRCCNMQPLSCCNFWSPTQEQYCDLWGPQVTSELTAEPCPAMAWDCMFMRTDMVQEEYTIIPGTKDMDRIQSLNDMGSTLIVIGIILILLHPFVWEQVKHLLLVIAESIIHGHYKKMLKRHLASQDGEKKKKAKKPKPVDDDLNDGKPIDAPIIEPLSPGDPDAAALRWQNVDPLRVGTVSARVLQPVGSPLDMSYMPGYQTMMNTSASSMYGPDHLPNVPAHGITNRTMNSTGDLAEVPPPPFSPPKLAMGQQSPTDWRFDRARAPVSFPASPDRIRKGTARDLDGQGYRPSMRGAARYKPGTLRESGKVPSSALNRSGSTWGFTGSQSPNASCTTFYGEEGRLRHEAAVQMSADSPFGGDERLKIQKGLGADREKYVSPHRRATKGPGGKELPSSDRYAHYDGFAGWVAPPKTITVKNLRAGAQHAGTYSTSSSSGF